MSSGGFDCILKSCKLSFISYDKISQHPTDTRWTEMIDFYPRLTTIGLEISQLLKFYALMNHSQDGIVWKVITCPPIYHIMSPLVANGSWLRNSEHFIWKKCHSASN